MAEMSLLQSVVSESSSLKLEDGSRIGVIGAGPSGSLFCFFLLSMARRIELDINVDIYEPQDFSRDGPAGCNHCGGIISESLVQILASEGINIPREVLQSGIDSYVLHTDVGNVRIDTPLLEKRIAAIYRGSGPLGQYGVKPRSFDAFLLQLAVDAGANLIPDRVKDCSFENGRPTMTTRKGLTSTYDLIAGSVGVNSSGGALFEDLGLEYKPPKTTKTFICEFPMDQDVVQKYFGNSMHVFLLNIPRLKFAALIPKRPFVTMCLLGKEIDKELVQSFLDSPEVKDCFPSGFSLLDGYRCQCFPKINIRGAKVPYSDRIVLVGDAAITRLYKDGIGAAYSTAKAAATTAIFNGISSDDFKNNYWPACRAINIDNIIGKMIFVVTSLIQKRKFTKRGVLRLTQKEQMSEKLEKRLSTVLWDTFTGSSPYREIFVSTLNPIFLGKLLWETAAGILPANERQNRRVRFEKRWIR